ncbi:MAG: hypothetical protein ACRDMZ_07500 [Solirubrobacteraceae bacterium]
MPPIAVDGNTALAGAPDAAGGGAVFVYARGSAGWAPAGAIVPPEPGVANFGFQVALAGDFAAVSAQVLVGTVFESIVYVYARTGGAWTLAARLEGTGGDDGFGEAIAMTSQVLVIAAPRGTDPCGKTFVYERRGRAWALTATLSSPACSVLGAFGGAVAVDDRTIVVGAASQDAHGVAYVFERRGRNWGFTTALTAADAQPSSVFGGSLAVDGRQIAVGAFGADASTGAVYVFERRGGTWQQQAKLVPAGAEPGDFAGFSVTLDHGVIATGALNANAVTVFAEAHGAWTEEATVTGDAGGMAYGFRVDLARDTLGVFGFIPGTLTRFLGALYLYDLER